MPQRVVSLAPSITETIFALGKEDVLVGVTAHCQYPPKVIELVRSRRLGTVGSYSITNFEKVFALNPDMVIATKHAQKSTLEKLQEGGLEVLVLDYPRTVEEMFEIILSLGNRLGVEDRASSLISSLRKRVESVKERTEIRKSHSVFFELSDEPLITVSGRIWMGDMIRLAGGTNIFEDRGEAFPVVQPNDVKAHDPDAMIVAVLKPEDVEEVYEREGWGEMKALKEGRVFGVDANVAEKPTPRAIDLLEKMSEMLP
jgi:iron complex transport system substrate-binding protein